MNSEARPGTTDVCTETYGFPCTNPYCRIHGLDSASPEAPTPPSPEPPDEGPEYAPDERLYQSDKFAREGPPAPEPLERATALDSRHRLVHDHPFNESCGLPSSSQEPLLRALERYDAWRGNRDPVFPSEVIGLIVAVRAALAGEPPATPPGAMCNATVRPNDWGCRLPYGHEGDHRAALSGPPATPGAPLDETLWDLIDSTLQALPHEALGDKEQGEFVRHGEAADALFAALSLEREKQP